MSFKKELLFAPDAIAARVAELAETISKEYADREPVLIGVLKGAFPFTADLIRRVTIPVTVDFIRARSYAGSESSGAVEFLLEPTIDLSGRDVLILEDILDTGVTAQAIRARLRARNPRSLRICTLLDKPSRRTEDIHADYVGFEIRDVFVVGYGMDLDENFRGLPGIHILERDALD